MVWKTGTGVVKDVRYVGPPGANVYQWTAIFVDLDSGERISAILESKVAAKNIIAPGDRIQLEYQPGQNAGIGWFGTRRGLCRNIKVVSESTSFGN